MAKVSDVHAALIEYLVKELQSGEPKDVAVKEARQLLKDLDFTEYTKSASDNTKANEKAEMAALPFKRTADG